MVLQGLKHSLFLGWISGVIFIKSPTGLPELARKKSPRTLFLMLLFIANIVIRFDFYFLQYSSLKGESMITKFLNISLLIGESVFDLFFRVSLLVRSKLLVRFLKTLESDMKKIAANLKLTVEDRKEWRFAERLIYCTLLFHIVSSVLTTLWVTTISQKSSSSSSSGYRSFLTAFLPEWLYGIFFYLFGELPIVCSNSVSLALVIVTTFHCLWIFYDFCESVQGQIAIQNGQEKKAFVKHNLGELEGINGMSVFSVAASAFQVEAKYEMEPITTEKLIGKLEHLRLICGQFDKICGPILLGLIVRAVYVLISSANSILLYANPENEEEKWAKHNLDLFLFPTEMAQLWLLPMGCMFKRKIMQRKEELARMAIFMTNLDARTDMRNVMTFVSDWSWILTGGPGFFEVDRPLLSGVLSSLMTYVTIIFQLNAPSSLPTAASSEASIVLSNRTGFDK